MKSLIIILLLIITTPVFAQYKITEYTRDSNVSDDDIVCGANSPDSSATNACFTLGQLRTSIGTSGTNWGSINGVITAQNWQSSQPYIPRGGVNWLDINAFVDGTNIGIGTSETNALLHISSTNATNLFEVDDAGNADTTPFVITSSGNVGIGTPSPTAPNAQYSMHYFADRNAGTFFAINNPNTGNIASSGVTLVTTDVEGNFRATPTTSSGIGAATLGRVAVTSSTGLTYQTATDHRWYKGSVEQMRLDSNSNLGIGTVTPQALLDITSTAAQDLFEVNDNGSGDSTPFVITSTGNVGIGTPSPTAQNANYLVHVFSNANTNRALAVTNKDTGSNAVTRIELVGNDSNGFVQNAHTGTTFSSGWEGKTMLYNETGNGVIVSSNVAASSIQFMNGNTERMIIKGINVGIGSTNPEGALVIRSSSTNIGWTPVNAANQACNTTCASGCVFGIDTSAVGNILACTDATADSCLCAGSN